MKKGRERTEITRDVLVVLYQKNLEKVGIRLKHGFSLYRGVIIAWDEEYDTVILDIVDGMGQEKPLVAQYEGGEVHLLWESKPPKEYGSRKKIQITGKNGFVSSVIIHSSSLPEVREKNNPEVEAKADMSTAEERSEEACAKKGKGWHMIGRRSNTPIYKEAVDWILSHDKIEREDVEAWFEKQGYKPQSADVLSSVYLLYLEEKGLGVISRRRDGVHFIRKETYTPDPVQERNAWRDTIGR